MTWLAPKLKHKILIQKGIQTANDLTGSLDLTFETICTCWAGIEDDKQAKYLQASAGVGIDELKDSYKFIIRSSALYAIQRAFNSGFDSGFKSMQDILMMKNTLFILKQESSTVKGRRFRVTGMKCDDDHTEYVIARCEYIEEIGTGANG